MSPTVNLHPLSLTVSMADRDPQVLDLSTPEARAQLPVVEHKQDCAYDLTLDFKVEGGGDGGEGEKGMIKGLYVSERVLRMGFKVKQYKWELGDFEAREDKYSRELTKGMTPGFLIFGWTARYVSKYEILDAERHSYGNFQRDWDVVEEF